MNTKISTICIYTIETLNRYCRNESINIFLIFSVTLLFGNLANDCFDINFPNIDKICQFSIFHWIKKLSILGKMYDGRKYEISVREGERK